MLGIVDREWQAHFKHWSFGAGRDSTAYFLWGSLIVLIDMGDGVASPY